MPELPEVEAVRLRIQKAARGRQVAAVRARPDARVLGTLSPAKLRKSLVGARVRGTDRRGKYFWLTFDTGESLLLHLGMAGHIDLLKRGEESHGNPRSIRLELEFDNGSKLQFHDYRRFGRIRLLEDPLHSEPVSELGPDPLHSFPTAKELHAQLSRRGAPIKALLLDQSLFAGVGNWIADEVLYQSRISPHRTARSLSAEEVRRIRTKLLLILRNAVRAGDGDHYPKSWLFHHRWSKGQKGPTTGREEPIVHHTIGGRTTAWVPTVQH
jgi:formamidopyrimidine-DNA glycosylase